MKVVSKDRKKKKSLYRCLIASNLLDLLETYHAAWLPKSEKSLQHCFLSRI